MLFQDYKHVETLDSVILNWCLNNIQALTTKMCPLLFDHLSEQILFLFEFFVLLSQIIPDFNARFEL